MQLSDQQFQAFAESLYAVYTDYEQRAHDENQPVENQMMWAIAANLVVKIAASAQAVTIHHEGTKQ